MTAARQRYQFEPATMTFAEVAEYAFRRNESWLRDFIQKDQTFPPPDSATKLFFKLQVDRWLAGRFGESAGGQSGDEALLIARAKRPRNA